MAQLAFDDELGDVALRAVTQRIARLHGARPPPSLPPPHPANTWRSPASAGRRSRRAERGGRHGTGVLVLAGAVRGVSRRVCGTARSEVTIESVSNAGGMFDRRVRRGVLGIVHAGQQRQRRQFGDLVVDGRRRLEGDDLDRIERVDGPVSGPLTVARARASRCPQAGDVVERRCPETQLPSSSVGTAKPEFTMMSAMPAVLDHRVVADHAVLVRLPDEGRCSADEIVLGRFGEAAARAVQSAVEIPLRSGRRNEVVRVLLGEGRDGDTDPRRGRTRSCVRSVLRTAATRW